MLALRLGKTVRELLATVDAVELQEWRIFDRYHPMDDARDDARTALVCRTMANAWRGKGQRAFTVKDFMPDYHKRQKSKQPSLRQQFVHMCAAKGIKVKG